MKRTGGGWRLIGASIVVFASGPVAAIAIPWLQRAHLIASTPLWILIGLLVACSVSNALVIAIEGRLPPTWGLQLRAAVAALSTAWVVYATGWGSLLVIAYAIAIADAMRVHGSKAWRPGLAWSIVAVFIGEVTIEMGISPSIMRPSVSHGVAGATTCCLVLIVRTLGASSKTAGRAHV